MRSALLIFNPVAGRRRQRLLDRVSARLAADGVDVAARPTEAPGHATEIARQAVRERPDAVLVLGGDGTVREVAAGLLGTDLPLGILPAGTVNVLVRSLGLPLDPLRAAARIRDLSPRPFDVGRCGATPFLMMASAGLDAAALHDQDRRLKERFGRVGILVDGLRSWWRYPYPAVEVSVGAVTSRVTLAAACNIPHYGGPFTMAPGARFDDGRLDLVCFTGSGRAATLGFVARALGGRHTDRDDVSVRRVPELGLDGPPEVRLQVDGDPCDECLPVRISVEPGALSVLGPSSPAAAR